MSTLVCGVLFLAPLIRAMQGRSDILPEVSTAVLETSLPPNDMRRDYLRGQVAIKDGLLRVTPLARQDSSLLRVLATANALAIRPEHAPAIAAGEAIDVIRLL